MATGDAKHRVDVVESREEAMDAIANALEFLRRETAALGLHDVSDMLGKARVRVRNHESAAPAGPDRH